MDALVGGLVALGVAAVIILGCAFLIGGRYEVVAGPTSYVRIDRLTGDMLECRNARCFIVASSDNDPLGIRTTPLPSEG